MATNDPKPTKAERREAARAEAARIKAEEEARRKRVRLITVGGIVALLVVVVAVIAFVLANAKEKPQGPAAGQEIPLTGEEITTNLSPIDTYQAGAPGAIAMGSSLEPNTANEGAPVVELYADFACPHCYDFDRERLPMLQSLAESGVISLVMHPVAILDRSDDYSDFSSRALDAYFAIAQSQPEILSEVGDAFYNLWHQFGIAGMQGPPPGSIELADAAATAGVEDELVQQIKDGSVPRVAKAATEAYGATGWRGTPNPVVNGEPIPPEEWGPNAEALKSAIMARLDSAP
ncbi:MAG: thioredoxin domain-containing protein [Bowdeniella nasicola]|nr:thioredoxin domain-containing protein [Bowdeniella nasicola]